MDLASFLTSVLTSFVIFVVLVLVFTFLSRRPGNAPVYYPSLLLRGLDPWEVRRRGTRSPVGWIRDAISASETDVIAAGGVDAAVYLVFLSSGTANLWLLLSSFFCLAFAPFQKLLFSIWRDLIAVSRLPGYLICRLCV